MYRTNSSFYHNSRESAKISTNNTNANQSTPIFQLFLVLYNNDKLKVTQNQMKTIFTKEKYRYKQVTFYLRKWNFRVQFLFDNYQIRNEAIELIKRFKEQFNINLTYYFKRGADTYRLMEQWQYRSVVHLSHTEKKQSREAMYGDQIQQKDLPRKNQHIKQTNTKQSTFLGQKNQLESNNSYEIRKDKGKDKGKEKEKEKEVEMNLQQGRCSPVFGIKQSQNEWEIKVMQEQFKKSDEQNLLIKQKEHKQVLQMEDNKQQNLSQNTQTQQTQNKYNLQSQIQIIQTNNKPFTNHTIMQNQPQRQTTNQKIQVQPQQPKQSITLQNVPIDVEEREQDEQDFTNIRNSNNVQTQMIQENQNGKTLESTQNLSHIENLKNSQQIQPFSIKIPSFEILQQNLKTIPGQSLSLDNKKQQQNKYDEDFIFKIERNARKYQKQQSKPIQKQRERGRGRGRGRKSNKNKDDSNSEPNRENQSSNKIPVIRVIENQSQNHQQVNMSFEMVQNGVDLENYELTEHMQNELKQEIDNLLNNKQLIKQLIDFEIGILNLL